MESYRGTRNKTANCAYLIFDKGGKDIYQKKAYSANDAGKTRFPPAEGEIRLPFTLYKNHLKWIKERA